MTGSPNKGSETVAHHPGKQAVESRATLDSIPKYVSEILKKRDEQKISHDISVVAIRSSATKGNIQQKGDTQPEKRS